MASKAKGLDPKTEATFATVQKSRHTGSLISDVAKAASAVSKQYAKLIEAELAFVAALQSLGQHQGSDLGDGFLKIADHFNTTAGKQTSVARSLQEDITNFVARTSKSDETEIDQFESDYKKVRGAIKTQIDKAEQATKKAGKKGAAALQQSITDLNDRIKEGEQTKSDRLKQVVIIDRKKSCVLLGNFYTLLTHESNLHAEAQSKVASLLDPIKALSNSQNNLPDKVQDLITDAQRTFVAVQADDSYNDSYTDSYETTNYGYDASQPSTLRGGAPPPPPPFGRPAQPASYGSVVALYDYDGQQEGDLAFYAGDYIELTAEDDGSGWMSGSLNGRFGVFPTSYVQYS